MSMPTEKQLDIISSLTGKLANEDNWYVVNFLACDNLINRGYRKWALNVIEAMKNSSIGIPLLHDHLWDIAEAGCGFIIEANIIKSDVLPAKQTKGCEPLNRSIFKSEGYIQLILTAAIPRIEEQQEIIAAIENRIVNACSTGGILSRIRMICPHCTNKYNREITFDELDSDGSYICPHYIPNSHLYYQEKDGDITMAEYVILDGEYDNVELSICQIGQLPNAQILRT